MADSPESEDETKQRRFTLLETATSVLQIRQRAEQEIRRTNEVLELPTRELAQAPHDHARDFSSLSACWVR
jgi:hypothetical protein